MSEVEQLVAMFVQMGSERQQAEVMARQLLKRADQIAEERGVERMEALAQLLDLVRAGRAGESYEKPLAERDDGPQ